MKKKIIATLLSIMCLSVSFPAANAANIATNSIPISTNEADYYLELQESTDSELNELGYSDQEIEQLRKTSLEQAIMERAKLDTTTLHEMGYSNADIAVLREYTGEPITRDSQVYAALAQVSGLIVCKGASNSQISFEYQWEWDKVPVVNQTDSVALCWQAQDIDGYNIGVSVVSTSHTVNYRAGTTIKQSKTVERNSQMQGASSQFNRIYTADGINYYAMDGVFKVTVKKDGTFIQSLKVARAYGHITVSLNVNPTINVTFDGGFGISFSSLLTPYIDKLDDDRIIQIYSNGSVVDA